ncbi:hypothetical protein HJB79_14995 [Rhizobium lentis]|uniref:hypothetical protein n=1 Tax=Rhizobium lentis TaxID=1138194 RepID=UPI001C8300A0|nr:hypothetical protein [Rhizobium lentis]MBX5140066.1 hypothetical protein [Rhizobium lentis]
MNRFQRHLGNNGPKDCQGGENGQNQAEAAAILTFSRINDEPFPLNAGVSRVMQTPSN